VAGERLFPLAPLGPDKAVELFTVRAEQQGIPVGDGPEVREVCRRPEGIPLAVEPAAGRLGALSPAQLLERLDDRFRLLTGGGRDAQPRHQALRTADRLEPRAVHAAGAAAVGAAVGVRRSGRPDLLGSVPAVELVALVTAAEGDAAEAAVLQGAAGRMWSSVGLPLFGSASFNAPHELCEATARETGRRPVRGVRAAGCAARPAGGGGAGAAAGGVGGTAGAARGCAGVAGRMQQPAASPTSKGGETAG
jgi:hypothetical protein